MLKNDNINILKDNYLLIYYNNYHNFLNKKINLNIDLFSFSGYFINNIYNLKLGIYYNFFQKNYNIYLILIMKIINIFIFIIFIYFYKLIKLILNLGLKKVYIKN